MAAGLVETDGATPAASLGTMIPVDIARTEAKSDVVRSERGVIGLRGVHAAPAGGASR
ncbi:MAG: hypothetical protein KGS47_14460 [Chloroflexi bacterium]|nr:hypothetical protein [Chloroflexota bacterium]